MQRSLEVEILDRGGVAPETRVRAHRALTLTHRVFGNHAAILRAIESDDQPVRCVLDIGCGHGALMDRVRRQLGVDVIGVDLRRPSGNAEGSPILKLDAVRDVLPPADVAVSVCMVHHLGEEEFVEMIRNVGRSCRRFVVLDLVRHRLPLAVFSAFAPLCLPEVNVLDGRQSIRRAYTGAEFCRLIARAIKGTSASFQHHVAPFWIRQLADIRFRSR